MDKKQVIEKYIDLKKLVIQRKDQFERLMNFLETETEWIKAPASTKYHLCEECGLLEHSVNAIEIMLKLKTETIK